VRRGSGAACGSRGAGVRACMYLGRAGHLGRGAPGQTTVVQQRAPGDAAVPLASAPGSLRCTALHRTYLAACGAVPCSQHRRR
jgi:hypothetical protein